MKKCFIPYIICTLQLLTATLLLSCNDTPIPFQKGSYTGETNDGVPDGYGIYVRGSHTYEGQWSDGKPNGYGRSADPGSCYEGGFYHGKRQGQGRLRNLSDSTVYCGEWKNGRREGYGSFTDSKGRRCDGVWHADTLAYGSTTENNGIYEGSFNRAMKAQGHGSFLSSDGLVHYEGHWTDGRYDGFGFELHDSSDVRCGWWRKGRFLGERMRYTSARVYGIDISHYQHGGRPRRRFRGYPIQWNKLRITHMGGNTKNSIGKVDYPVSFCYIKTTQGISISNPYYRTDAPSARKAGIRVGAYHFMSPIQGLAQAKWFLRNSPVSKADLPPMLDVELTKGQITRMGGPSAMFREMLVWLHTVERHTGKRPILYISQRFIDNYFPNAPKEILTYRVWIARYSEFRPYVKLLYWQLTPYGRVSGIRGDVDINVFNGSIEQFRQYDGL